jgi:ATP-dependent helicase HrpA
VRRVREWRDIHSQLVSAVGEQGWKPNLEPASYEQLHLSMLSGLLGNIGCKSDEEDFYLGARGIKFHRHPGSRLSKRPGRWIVSAELVETTRLFGRCMAAIEPQWLEQVGAHLLKKQLLDPHWEKKAARVSALERATLYGLVIYNNRRADYGAIDPAGAREIFIRQALVGDQWESKLPFLAANHKLIAQVQELEHKQRRQDVLVDDELIFAFYDSQVPADIHNGAAFERWWKDASRAQPRLLFLSREELMRHEAAGITTQAFPKVIRLGGVDCSANYLHEPGDRGALRVAGARHAQRQDPGPAQKPAAKIARPLCAPARKRHPPGRRAVGARDFWQRFSDGRAAEKSAPRNQPRHQAQRLQARHAQRAPVHEPARGRRTRPPARHGPQPWRPQGRMG